MAVKQKLRIEVSGTLEETDWGFSPDEHCMELASKEKLYEWGYTTEIQFSGFQVQGNWAGFTATVDIPAWIKANHATDNFPAYLNHDEAETCLEVERLDGRSEHRYTVAYPNRWSDKLLAEIIELERRIAAEVREFSRRIYKEEGIEKEYTCLV